MQFIKKVYLLSVLTGSVILSGPAHSEPANNSAQVNGVEVVFVLDTTGSMNGLIEGAKRKIWSIANTIVDQNPDAKIKMGLVAYRDIGDDYVTKSFNLTTDIQGIYANLLTFEADGGGDAPESVNEALDVAVTKQDWTSESSQQNVKRIIFLVGDEPPHMDYKHDRKYPVVLKDATQKGIIVNAIQVDGTTETTRYWKEIAKLGNGKYIAIPQDGGKVVDIETPYDDEIIQVQAALNNTVLAYGTKTRKVAVENKKDAYRAATKSSAAEMSKYVNKSSKGAAVVTGKGDLVADMNKGLKLETIPEQELPEVMQKMDVEKRAIFIQEQNAKRIELAKTLKEKVEKRDAYVLEQKAKMQKAGKTKDSFDTVVEKMLSEQIKGK
ncbi:vWA domain-containing protein [Microvirga sp. W0021]|uniref:VWA domain-containing protein n=1 Tax=Hohaiivirga grylli TaxID=3133970 RepID=A0ABV0BMT7_9HYPH